MSKPQALIYDPAAISRMSEPLTVRVERVAGALRTPIEMPTKEGGAPGQGWLKDDISRLEGWLVNDWCGGGTLHITVMDALDVKHEWRVFYPTVEHPIKQPPTMPSQSTLTSSPATTKALAQARAQAQANAGVTWPPTAAEYAIAPAPPAPPVATPTPAPVAPTPATIVVPTPTERIVPAMTYQPSYAPSAPPRDDSEKRALAEEARALKERLAAVERDRLNDLHRAEVDKIRADSEKQLEELKRLVAAKTDDSGAQRFSQIENVLSKLIEKIDAKPTGPDPAMLALQHKLDLMERERSMQAQAPDPRLAALEATLKQQAEQMQRERDRADADRREQAMQQQLRDQREQMERQLAALRDRPTGPDPTMMLFLDMMKSSQQQAQMQMERQQAMMLKPQDIIALTKESSNGLDDVKRSMTGLFSDVFDMQKQVMQQAMQFAPQGESTTARLIETGMAQAAQAFERYGQGKTSEAVSHAKAAAEQAKAQAEQMRLQQMHLQMMAQQEAAARQPQLNGVNPPENANHDAPVNASAEDGSQGTRQAAQAREVKPAPIEVIDATPHEAGTNGHGTVIKRMGHTDQEWFGLAMPEVEKLRTGVATYLKNVARKSPKLDPKTHQPIGISPELATEAILKAADKIVTLKIDVLAFRGLFLEARMDEFMEILLPDAHYQYRADVAGMLLGAMQAMQNGGVDEDDDVNDEDGDGDDVE